MCVFEESEEKQAVLANTDKTAFYTKTFNVTYLHIYIDTHIYVYIYCFS